MIVGMIVIEVVVVVVVVVADRKQEVVDAIIPQERVRI
jgi:hypothetical protein